jgi:hypothetical protein
MIRAAQTTADPNFTQGMTLLTKSAEAGYIPAMDNLVMIYNDQNYYHPTLAQTWYNRALAARQQQMFRGK